MTRRGRGEEPTVIYLGLSPDATAEKEATAWARAKTRDQRERLRPDLSYVDLRTLMELPFFALSTKPCEALKPFTHSRRGLNLTVETSVPELGVATIRDADIIIYLATILLPPRSEERLVSRTATLSAHQLLQARGQGTGGRYYDLLEAGLERLCRTRITTNIGPDGKAEGPMTFSLIEAWQKMEGGGIEVALSEWFRRALAGRHVLSVASSYFDLSSNLERWLYRVARKQAGVGYDGWRWKPKDLWIQSGAISLYPRFKSAVREIVQRDALPDYRLEWDESPREPVLRAVLRDGSRTSMAKTREASEGRTSPEE